MCTNLFLLLLLLLFTLPWEVIFLEIAIFNIYNWHIQIVDAYTFLLTHTKYSLAIFSKILAYTIVINKFVDDNGIPEYFFWSLGKKYWCIQLCRCQ